jgi:signal transduction histidine kinase
MGADTRFARAVTLACHDLRTPLATAYGFARTLVRTGELDERSARFVGMIEEAAAQMTELLESLGTVARIESGRWEPALREIDTLELARSDDPRVDAAGAGATVRTEETVVRRSLAALALAAIRHGPVERVAWRVDGTALELAPITAAAGPVVVGDEPRDFGALAARAAIEALGGSLALDGETLRVRLA